MENQTDKDLLGHYIQTPPEEKGKLTIKDIESFGFKYIDTDEVNISNFYTPEIDLYQTLVIWANLKAQLVSLQNCLPGKKRIIYINYTQVRNKLELSELLMNFKIDGKNVLEFLDCATKQED